MRAAPVVLGLTITLLLGARAFTAGGQAPPTFRSGVRLVDVDVVVTDRDGNPVRDLARDDFEIIEDGRSQPIRAFSLVDLPFAAPMVLADQRARKIPFTSRE